MKLHLSLAPLAIVTFGLLGTAVPSFASSICDAVAGNIVANCGFELGTYSSNGNPGVPDDWTSNAGFDSEPSFNHTQFGFSNSGSNSLSIGNYDYQPVAALSQTLTDTDLTTYNGSLFAYYGGGGDGDTSAFLAVLNGVTTLLTLNDTTSGQSWEQYTFSFVGSGTDVLTIEAATNPHFGTLFDNKRGKIAAKSLVLKAFSYKSFKIKYFAGISS